MKYFLIHILFLSFISCMETEHTLTEKGKKAQSRSIPSYNSEEANEATAFYQSNSPNSRDPSSVGTPAETPHSISPRQIESARFFKCYNRFARVRPDKDHPVLVAIQQSSSPSEMKNLAVNGCMELLEKGNLFGSGSWMLDPSEEGGLGNNVLKTFNDLHISWLPNLDNLRNADFHELAEPALRNTLALFADNFSHKDVLSGNRYLRGVRSQGVAVNPSYPNRIFNFAQYPNFSIPTGSEETLRFGLDSYAIDSRFKFTPTNDGSEKVGNLELNFGLPDTFNIFHDDPEIYGVLTLPMSTDGSYESLFNADGNQLEGSDGRLNFKFNSTFNVTKAQNLTCSPQPLERGMLKGIKLESEKCEFKGQNFKGNSGISNSRMIDTENNPENLYYHAGGGAIGGISYLLNNHDNVFLNYEIRPMTHRSNDGFARYLASNIMRDFLCRDLPTLIEIPSDLPDDAKKIDNIEYAHPQHTYRAEGSCMECHATTDYMSAAFRNLVVNPMTTNTNKYLDSTVDVNRNGNKDVEERLFNENVRIKSASILKNNELTQKFPRCAGTRQAHCDESFCTWNAEIELCEYDKSKTDLWLSCTEKNNYIRLRNLINEIEGGPSEVSETELNELKALRDNALGCIAHKKFFHRADDWIGNTPPWDESSRDKIYAHNGSMRWPGKYCDKINKEKDPCEEGEFTTVKSAGHHFRDWHQIWFYSKPYGRLIMQDIDGNHINKPIIGVEELASELRETIDYSACYAKRYFHFLTGKNVTFFTNVEGDPDNPINNGELNQGQVNELTFVRDQGEKLKNESINLQGLIRKIVESDHFIESVFGRSDEYSVTVEKTFSSAELSFASLQKCAGCHQAGSMNFLSNMPLMSDSCEAKKNYLDAFVDITYSLKKSEEGSLIARGSPCDSVLYRYLESGRCDNHPSGKLDSKNKWMDTNMLSGKWKWSDTQNIKKIINQQYSCDN